MGVAHVLFLKLVDIYIYIFFLSYSLNFWVIFILRFSEAYFYAVEMTRCSICETKKPKDATKKERRRLRIMAGLNGL